MKTLLRTAAALAAGATMLLGAAQAQDRTGWPQDLTIATASQGGTYFIYGNGLAAFISESLGVNASGEVTGGPVQNVTLVQTGDLPMGMVTMGPAYAAWTGKSELAPGLEHKDIRALFPMYQTPFQIIALKSSGISSVADLEGKRVGVGPAGGTPGTYWPRIFEALGLDVTTSNAGASDSASQVKDGLIDAFAFAAGMPISAFAQLAAENEVNIFAFTPEEQAKVLEAFPELAALTIPGGTYAGFPEASESVALWNFAIAHKDMPDSLAYEITKLVLENNDRMVQIHAAAKETLMENWSKNGFLPFHPGAVKYYEEKGQDIPEKLRGGM